MMIFFLYFDHDNKELPSFSCMITLKRIVINHKQSSYLNFIMTESIKVIESEYVDVYSYIVNSLFYAST